MVRENTRMANKNNRKPQRKRHIDKFDLEAEREANAMFLHAMSTPNMPAGKRIVAQRRMHERGSIIQENTIVRRIQIDKE
jgi:hypothetical protein